VETQKPPSKVIKYERKKLKYPPKTSPSPRNNYYSVPSISTQKMQASTIFEITALLGLPEARQQANKSITLLGITQDIPK
jgi:hypothetical protein